MTTNGSPDDTTTGTTLFAALSAKPADPLLALIGAFRRDPRDAKIDLGVGVYRDEHGRTPTFQAVRAAELRLVATQATKAYLGPEGNLAFLERLAPIALGGAGSTGYLGAVQTPGGTGALRLAAELIAAAKPGARVFVGDPTWPNHPPILNAARLNVVRHDYYDPASHRISFDAMIDALRSAGRGDVVLLHASCHNPTGADLDIDQWRTVATLLAANGALPLIDMAYHGLGDGLDADAAGARLVVDATGEALIAYSCDKNFGLYRERTGALFAVSSTAARAQVVQSNLLSLARANWSMPPDHGAAAVAEILGDSALERDWRDELDTMSARIRAMRVALATAVPRFDYLRAQHGMFGMLGLASQQVDVLRERHGVYMPRSGRINIAGLTPANVGPFAQALASLA